MSIDVMFDLETLGVSADCAIVSIGAVEFDLEAGIVLSSKLQSFYQVVDLTTQKGRVTDGGTVAWWMQQGKDAQAVFSQRGVSLVDALTELAAWMPPVCNVWSNGADFDLPILAHAYTSTGIKKPWSAYTGRCYRTYKNLPGARAVKAERMSTAHNALADAIYQAHHVCAIHAALFGGKGGAA